MSATTRTLRNACLATVLAFAVLVAAGPTGSAFCVGSEPMSWNDNPGGSCASVNAFPPDPWVCVTATNLVSNCV